LHLKDGGDEEIMREPAYFPTKYKGRDYSKAIDLAVRRAAREFAYPTSNSSMGMKKLLGRSYYASLISDEICHARIPGSLKKRIIGAEKYKRCKRR